MNDYTRLNKQGFPIMPVSFAGEKAPKENNGRRIKDCHLLPNVLLRIL